MPCIKQGCGPESRWPVAKIISIVNQKGGVGKTTTKNLTRDVCAAYGSVVATKANQNNELGVPRTLLNADPETAVVVVEMGMRGRGQIAELCDFVRPVWGLITNVGESHIELLGSRENIARADMASPSPIPAGMTKADYAEMRFSEALTEADDFDLLVMGRTQGKGCYCFVNGVLKTQIDKYVGNYRYMVVDNEAGLEHISRGTLPHVDTMLLISDCSRRGIQAVGRIAEMIREMDLKPGEMKLIVNRAPNGVLNPGVMEEINKYGLQLAGVLPQDETVYEYDCEGKPSSQVPDKTPVKIALAAVMRDLNL